MKILKFSDKNFSKKLEATRDCAQASETVSKIVSSVISDVRKRGDSAVAEMTKKFDGANLAPKKFKVSPEEIAAACAKIPAQKKRMISDAIKCVKEFHIHTMPKNWRAKNPHGATIGENFYPIKRVGLYVPGGHAPLVSTVVMTATLAKLAGCPEICVCTPPSKDGAINPYILCALKLLGIDEIYKVGGAQAIAAMGVGTKTIAKVDKLFGPGNAFVIEAKRQLFGEVGCDLLPGPSEILVLADDSANPEFVAADLLSQAEHGSGREKIYFVSLSKTLVSDVKKSLSVQAKKLSRADALIKIINDGCFVIEVDNITDAIAAANEVAPEHIEIHARDAEKLAARITTAGAILCGSFTPTVLGDFTAGPSHTLPTGGTGKFSSGLQLIDFIRRSSFVKYDATSAKRALPTVNAFGEMEMLDAHAQSLRVREQKK